MKTLSALLTFAILIVSCKSKVADNTMVLSAFSDSAEYKEFVKWKQANVEVAKKQSTVINKEVPTASVVPVAVPAAIPKRKGWSKAAKGTIIGALTGAAAGAIIDKRNRGAGAAIGTVLGAGAGYGIGRHLDKKDGRNNIPKN